MRTETTTYDETRIVTASANAPMDGRRWERVGAVTGIAFVGLQLAILPVLGRTPKAAGPVREIRNFLVHDGERVLRANALDALAAFFFLWFLGAMWSFLRRAEGGPGRLSTTAYGAGLVTAALSVVAGLPAVALAWNHNAASADGGLLRTIWTFNDLALVPIGASAGVFLLAAALVILRTRVLPVWIAWVGVASCVAGVVGLAQIVSNDPDSPLGALGLLGFLLAMVFVLATSVSILVRAGRGERVA
jgi:hypothetical protein